MQCLVDLPLHYGLQFQQSGVMADKEEMNIKLKVDVKEHFMIISFSLFLET
jgi:hypothetical protein